MNNSQEQKIEHIIGRMLTDRSVDAPADALQYARNLYRTRAAQPKASMVQRILAVMRVDLAPNRAALGERSAGGSAARQILFDSGENAVDLRVTAVKNGFDIRGQILGEGFENGTVEIVNDQTSASANIDETGEFKLSGLMAGSYNVTITGDGAEIFIEQITLA